jgi:hypothetical protein
MIQEQALVKVKRSGSLAGRNVSFLRCIVILIVNMTSRTMQSVLIRKSWWKSVVGQKVTTPKRSILFRRDLCCLCWETFLIDRLSGKARLYVIDCHLKRKRFTNVEAIGSAL